MNQSRDELQSIVERIDRGGKEREEALWELEALESVVRYDDGKYLSGEYD